MRVSTKKPDPGEFADFAALVESHDGVEAFGESSFRDVREDRPARYLGLYDDGLVALAVMGRESSELAVHPDHRRQGLGSQLLAHVAQTASPMALWAHGNSEASRALAAASGLAAVRELWRMERDLAGTSRPAPRDDLTIRGYEPVDADALTRVNARAFATHPEQGAMVAADIAPRGGEIWLAEDDEGTIAGFFWIQRDPAELYVLGVDPDFQGRGIGSHLTALSLAELADGGADRVMLYVEADNVPARKAYERAGFEVARSDVQYEQG